MTLKIEANYGVVAAVCTAVAVQLPRSTRQGVACPLLPTTPLTAASNYRRASTDTDTGTASTIRGIIAPDF